MNREHIGPHAPGTYAGYRIDGCRCYPCCGARSAYDADRQRQITAGTWQPFTDAAAVREHLCYLQANGLGMRRIAELTGITRNCLLRMLRDCGQRKAVARVRTGHARAILALRPGIDTARDGALIDATGTLRRIRALIACGYPQAHLAARLGMSPGNFADFGTRPHITAGRARAMRALYDELSMLPPEAAGILPGSITRARGHAARNGWPKPLQWDDDEIDDPAAQPHYGPKRPPERGGKSADLIEEVRHLVGPQPLQLADPRRREAIAAQLEISISYLEKLVAKAA